MKPSSFVPVALVSVLVAAACGGPPAETPITKTTPQDTVPASGEHGTVKGGTCGASSVITTTACAPRTLPPSNATSDAGCKSDADCKDGVDGRCVKNGRDVGSTTSVRSPLLAEPPPPPPKTICTYDACAKNADCGAKARCACGTGASRNTCVPLDACTTDAECGQDKLCMCGASAAANACVPANCRTKADCDGNECSSGRTGTYCRTGKDTCKADKDCTGAAPGTYQTCDYDRDARAWKCRAMPLLPPG